MTSEYEVAAENILFSNPLSWTESLLPSPSKRSRGYRSTTEISLLWQGREKNTILDTTASYMKLELPTWPTGKSGPREMSSAHRGFLKALREALLTREVANFYFSWISETGYTWYDGCELPLAIYVSAESFGPIAERCDSVEIDPRVDEHGPNSSSGPMEEAPPAYETLFDHRTCANSFLQVRVKQA